MCTWYVEVTRGESAGMSPCEQCMWVAECADAQTEVSCVFITGDVGKLWVFAYVCNECTFSVP